MRFFILVSMIIGIAGCTALPPSWATFIERDPAAPQAQPIDQELMAQGRSIYREQYCGTCHQSTAANTRGTFGPAHDEAGRLASERIEAPAYNGEATTAAEYIYESITQPQVFYTPGYEATNHHMPPYAHLPADDLNALVYFLVQQR